MVEFSESSLRIIEAASKRFLYYGYQKTTMNEIAKDLGMSTGNLYRFFPSKLDIAEAIATQNEQIERVLLSEITQKQDTATNRLIEFLHHQLEDANSKISVGTKAYELAQVITAERPEFRNRRLAGDRVLLKQIYLDGVANNEFRDDENIDKIVKAIQSATTKFRFSTYHAIRTLQELQEELNDVIELLLIAIKKH